jgi:hypothetical protein
LQRGCAGSCDGRAVARVLPDWQTEVMERGLTLGLVYVACASLMTFAAVLDVATGVELHLYLLYFAPLLVAARYGGQHTWMVVAAISGGLCWGVLRGLGEAPREAIWNAGFDTFGFLAVGAMARHRGRAGIARLLQ